MLEALKESVVFNKIQRENIKKILEETKYEIKTKPLQKRTEEVFLYCKNYIYKLERFKTQYIVF